MVSRPDTQTCDHPDAWYDHVIGLWYFIGWAPPAYGIVQGWPWAGPVALLWVVGSLLIVGTAVADVWPPPSCRRCGYTPRRVCFR